MSLQHDFGKICAVKLIKEDSRYVRRTPRVKFSARVIDRRLKSYRRQVFEINALEKEIEALSDEPCAIAQSAFRNDLANGKSLDDSLIPLSHTVREAGKARTRTAPL